MIRTSWHAKKTTAWAAAALLATALISPAMAGRACTNAPLNAQAVTRGLALAEQTVQRLDASGAQVVALARAGQDLGQYGLRYSHMGLAYKDGSVWRVLHKLNQCGTASSSVYHQGIGDFFLDSPHEYIAGVVTFRPDVQKRLLPLLREGQSPKLVALHTRSYSMVAYPWAKIHQQSNQWAIETLAAAVDPGVKDRASAQDWLRTAGFEPTELHLSAFTRLGARMTAANVSFDDHPAALRFSGRIRTVTVDSVFAWLLRSGLGTAEWRVP